MDKEQNTQNLTAIKDLNSEYIPAVIERIDDGELFTLNDDNKTYSSHAMKTKFPGHLTFQFEFDILMKRFKGHFRILGWKRRETQ
jgi:hypothetical protein